MYWAFSLVAVMLAALFLCTYVPVTVMWLPHLLGY